MKNLLQTVAFLITGMLSVSASTNTFMLNLSIGEATKIISSSEGGYLVLATADTNNTALLLIHINEAGDTTWTKAFFVGSPGAVTGAYLYETSDGGLIIGGSKMMLAGTYNLFLMKINAAKQTVWAKSYGTSANDETMSNGIRCTDKGFMLVGCQKNSGTGYNDIYIVKTDSSGNQLWGKTYGGTTNDSAVAIESNAAGDAFYIFGSTSSYGAGKSDMLLMNIDINGNINWTKTYGGIGNEFGGAIKRLSNGNLMLGGSASSFPDESNDSTGFYLFQITASGDTTASFYKSYNSWSTIHNITSIIPVTGGYILSGYQLSWGGKTAYLLKVSSTGQLNWNRNYSYQSNGGSFNSALLTSDDGILAVGLGSSGGGAMMKEIKSGFICKTNLYGYVNGGNSYINDFTIVTNVFIGSAVTLTTGNSGTSADLTANNFTMTRLDMQSTNNQAFAGIKNYGGTEYDDGTMIEEDANGYVMLGSTQSFTFGNSGGMNQMGMTAYNIIKTDKELKTVWSKIIGDSSANYWTNSLKSLKKGGYLVAGNFYSPIDSITEIFLTKLDRNGTILWSKTYGNADGTKPNAILETVDGNYLVAGTSTDNATGETGVYLVKTDTNGVVIWSKMYGKNSVYFWNININQTKKGDLLVTTDVSDNGGDILAMKIGADGTLVWSNTYGTAFYEYNGFLLEDNFENPVLVCSAYKADWTSDILAMNINKIDQSISSSNYMDYGTYDYLTKASLYSDSSTFIINGQTDNNTTFVSRNYSGGWPYWSYTYKNKDYDMRINNANVATDGGILLTGNMYDYGAGSADILAIKTDDHGYVMNCINTEKSPVISYITTPTTSAYVLSSGTGCNTGSTTISTKNIASREYTFSCSGNTLTDTTRFNKLFGNPTTKNEVFNSVKSTDDGGLILTGTSTHYNTDGSGGTSAMITKLKADNTVDWNKTYLMPSVQLYGKDVVQLSTGEYIILCELSGSGGHYLVKLNETGDTIWTKKYSVNMGSKALIKTSDDYVYIIGSNWDAANSTQGNVTKINANGGVEWSKNYGGAQSDEFFAGCENADGSLTIAGKSSSFGISTDLYVLKIKSTGDTIWTRTFGTDLEDIPSSIVSADGGYIIAGTTRPDASIWKNGIALIKISSDGWQDWSMVYYITDYDMSVSKIIKTADNNFAVSGNGFMMGMGKMTRIGLLMKVSSRGSLIWAKNLGGSKENTLNGLLLGKDGGYYACGQTNSFGGSIVYANLVKTDPDGYTGQCYDSKEMDINIKYLILNNQTVLASPIDITPTITSPAMTDKNKKLNLNIKTVSLSSGLAGTNVKCNGASNGAVALTLDGGVSPITFAWSNNSVTQNLSSLRAGLYKVTVTDNFGCQSKDSITITEPNPLMVQTFYTNVHCNAGADGTAWAIPSGGTRPYNFTWNTGQTDSLITSLYPGNFFVNVFDKNGCLIQDVLTITQPPAMTISVNKTDNTCHSGTAGTASVTVDNGTAPYTYHWSNNMTTQNISNLISGIYSVTVTDSCGASLIDNAIITEPDAMESSFTVRDISCNGRTDGRIDLTVTKGTAPYTFNWSNTSANQNISNLGVNNYTVTITDACTLTHSASTQIIQPALLTSNISKTNVHCYGGADGTAHVTPIGGTGPFTFLWNNGQTDSIAHGLFTGLQLVNVVDMNGCLASNNITLTQPAALSINLNPTHITCRGASTGVVTLTVSGGTTPYTYSWSNSTSTKNISGVVAGTYTVTVTDSCGNTISGSTVITQPDALSSSVNNTNVKCKSGMNGRVDLAVTGGTTPYQYAWSNLKTTQDISDLSTNTYYVTITDGCSAILKDTAIITEPSILNVVMNKTNTTCFGAGNGTATVSTTGGTSPYIYHWSNGQTDSIAVGLFFGNYSVNVIDANGCLASGLTSITQPFSMSINVSGTPSDCYGTPMGSADVTVSNGTKPYTYLWSNNATTHNLTNVAFGTYTVTVTDSCGYALSQSVIVGQPSPLSAIVEVHDAKCKGNQNGQIELVVSGGTLPYTYKWSNNKTTMDITALTAGNYTVTIYDQCNDSIIESATVIEPALLTASISKTNISCYGSNNGNATVHALGGTLPYSYLWNNNQSDSATVGLFPGLHSVNVIDLNGCLASTNTVLTQPSQLLISIAATNVTCNGASSGAANVTATGGTKPYSYSWSNGATTQNIASVDAGVYTITVTDSCGTTQIEQITINEPGVLSSNLVISNAKCKGSVNGAINLTPSNGTAPYQYVWSTATNKTTEDKTGLAAGTYYVTITDNCSATHKDTAVVGEPQLLTTSISKTNISCFGGSDGTVKAIPTGGTAPFTFLWNTGQNADSLSNLFPSGYSVNVVDANNCLASNNTSLTQPNAMEVELQTNNILCNGTATGIINLLISGGTIPYSYLWSNDSTTQNLTSIKAGSYTVTVTDACGYKQIKSTTVNEPEALLSTIITSDVRCNGKTNGSINLSVSGGTLPYSYNWSNGKTSQDILGLAADTFYVTITDACFDTTKDTAIVNEPDILSVTTTKTNATCFGAGNGTATATPVGGTAPYTYQWSDGQNTATAVDLYPSDYSLNAVDANGCLTSGLVTISQPNAMSVNITKNNINCVGRKTGSIHVTVSNGTPPFSYKWSNDSTTKDLTGISAGTYIITITDSCGMSLIKTTEITEPVAMTSELNISDVQCNSKANGSANLIVLGGSKPYTYNWSNGATNSLLLGLAADTLYVTVTDICGDNIIDTAIIKQPNLLTASMTKTNITCNSAGDGTATILAVGGTVPYTYQWNNSQISATAIGLFPGNYSVNVVDANGCMASGLVNITQPLPMMLALTKTNATCINGSNGNVNLTVSNGTKPFTFKWSNDETTQNITLIKAGTYTVTVTDSCGVSLTDSISVSQPNALAITKQKIDAKCFGSTDGSAQLTVTGGTAPYSYNWSNNATTKNNTSLQKGKYYVTVTDNCSIKLTDSISINEPSKISTTSVIKHMSCYGIGDGQISVHVTGGIEPFRFNWNNGVTDSIIQGLFKGNYSVNVFDANNCLVTDQYSITQPQSLVLELHSASSTCNNTNGILSSIVKGGTTPYSYAWSNGTTSSSLNNIIAGTYTLTVTDTNKCTISESIENIVEVPVQEICMVHVDLSGYNIVSWEKDPSLLIKEYKIYRQDHVTGVYNVIGTKPGDKLSVYDDITSTPDAQYERYKLTAVDNCGNESALSQHHKTMHIQTNLVNKKMQLQFTGYEGTPFTNYFIMRGNASGDTTSFTEIAAIFNSNSLIYTYTDANVPVNQPLYYYVRINLPQQCQPTGSAKATEKGPYTMSRSNVEDAGVMDTSGNNSGSGIEDIDEESNLFSIYPNPTRDELTVVASASLNHLVLESMNNAITERIQSDNSIVITNALGQVVLSNSLTRLLVNSSTIKLNIQALANGMYYVRIGNAVKKFVVNK